MTPAEPELPTDAEWKILKIVFEHDRCAAREVIAVATERYAWSASTVKTLLRRLVDKGHLLTRSVGNSLLYRPSRSAHKSLRRSADQLIEKTIDGAMGPLLHYMVQRSRLSASDLESLRALIDARQEAEEEES